MVVDTVAGGETVIRDDSTAGFDVPPAVTRAEWFGCA
jgi:hypothetical protein